MYAADVAFYDVNDGSATASAAGNN